MARLDLARLEPKKSRAEADKAFMFYVYLLLSEKDQRTYLGSTDNLERRIGEHNAGKNVSTRIRRPLRLIYKESYSNLSEARAREKYFKSRSGRRELKKIFVGLNIGE